MAFFRTHIKKIIIGLIVIIILGLVINKFRLSRQDPELTYNPKKDQVINPQIEDISEELILAGSIDAEKKADLRFQTSGQLTWVGVKVGDRVRKFQTIATLDKKELQKKLEIDLNNYKSALSNFEDTQDEYKDTTLTDEIKRILERSQNTLNNSVIAYESSELALRYSTLTTPIAGIVTKIDQPFSGTNITPTNASFLIIDPDSIYFKSEIDQDDVPKIKIGDSAKITLDSFPDEEFESTITYISLTPITGQSSIVYEVRFEMPVDNSNLKYRLGLSGDITIPLNQAKNVLTVPLEALIYQDKTYVLVKKENNQIQKIEVVVGIESDEKVEIKKGLSENDQVIIKK